MGHQPATEPERAVARPRGVLPRFTGLLAPENWRPDPRLALRGILGLMVPVLVGRALDLSALDLVGIAAFLLTFGDVTGSEQPRQLIQLGIGTVLGATALASGVIAGAHTGAATAGMFTWGLVAGLLGAYGNAGAALGLPVAWAYLELGLTTPIHTIGHALALAALYAVGGVWAVILASLINVIGPYGPLRERTVECYAVLAMYLDSTLCTHRNPPAPDAISPETRVRQTIASARLMAARTRRNQQATSEVGQRLLALLELADRLFSLGAALGDSRAVSAPRHSDAVLIEAIHAIALAIAGRTDTEPTQRLVRRLERLLNQEEDDETSGLRGRIAGMLVTALHVVAGEASFPADTAPDARNPRDPWRLIEPLRTCLTLESVVLRHALRFGVLTALAVAVQRLWDPPFGYWIPLTVSVVLKPYAGTTFTRGAQRLTGTVAGVAVGLAVSAMISGWAAQAVAVASAFFLLLAVLPMNYAWGIFFLSAGVVPFEALLTGSVESQIGLFRIVNTAVGGALALVGGRLLWLSSEVGTLQPVTAATMRAVARYAACIMGAFAPEADVEQARRQAGLMNSNLQAVFQRTMRELDREPARFHGYLLVVTMLQRLLVSLNTFRVIGIEPELALRERKRFAGDLALELERLGDAVEKGMRPAPSQQFSKAVHALHNGMARTAGGASLRSIVLARVEQQVLTLQVAAAQLNDAKV
jgi:uncharacterized membrane protein YccC